MLIFRRTVSIFLAVIGTLALVLAIVSRVAYAAVFNTDTYVETVTEVVSLSELRSEVSTFVTDSIVDGAQLDSPKLVYVLRRAKINPDTFQKTVRNVVETSVDNYMQSEQFMTLWSTTNRTAHEQLMTVLKDTSTPAKDFTIDASQLVKEMALSIADPKGVVSKFVPLKEFVPEKDNFEFKLIEAKSVQDLRDGLDAASKIKWALLVGSVVLLLASWLIFGRTRGAHRVVALSLTGAGIITLIAKQTGASAVADNVDEKAVEAAKAIYSIVTSPLTGYAIALLVIGLAGFGATFYKRTAQVDQASGSL